MPPRRVAIIGAGLSGLAAGIFARLNGFEATIFEHGAKPGGVSSSWKRKGYLIDGGIHFYMGCLRSGPTREFFRELGVLQEERYRPVTRYARFLDPAHGLRLDLTADLDRFVEEARAISPRDARFLNRFLAGAKAFARTDLVSTMAKPPELTTFLDSAKALCSLGRSLRYYSGRFARPMTEVVRELDHPGLREIFLHLFLPEVPYFFNLMLAGLLWSNNLAVRTDGSAGFNQALESRFIGLGGKIFYRSRVEKILIENNRAVGVRLRNGLEETADYVVSAADGRSTLFDLVGVEHVPPALATLYRDLELFAPVVLVNLGLDLELSGLPGNLIFRPPGRLSAGFPAREWWFVRLFGPERGFAPPGKILVQVMIDSAWEPWQKLRADMAAYQAEKERLAAQVIRELDRLHPGLGERVEMIDVATPHTWWRYTLNQRGAYEGFAITPKSFRTKIKRTLPGLDNFVMAGQWTVPGGGAVPSLLTGRHALMLICVKEGLIFRGGRFSV